MPIHARITGTGSCLPRRVVTNAELAERLDTSDAWIVSRTGIRERRIAAESETTSQLAVGAARAALLAAGRQAADVDLIVLATSTPDMIFPSTACTVQAELDVSGCPAFDVQAVCAGFVYALTTATQFVQAGSARCALVIGAETFTRLLDWNDRATAVLFGDGAGAVVLEASEAPGVLATRLQADGRQRDILSTPATVTHGAIAGSPYLQMDGQAVFRFAVKALAEQARSVLDQAGMSPAQLDWLIPHQANVRILDAVARQLALPKERVVVTVDRHANTSAASIPLALDEAVRDGRIQSEQTVLLSGIGGGFAWGSVLLRW